MLGLLFRQIRKLPGEWARSRVVDFCIEWVTNSALLRWGAYLMSVLLGTVGTVLTWARHDPAIAILLGLCIALIVLLLVAVGLWIIGTLTHRHGAPPTRSESTTRQLDLEFSENMIGCRVPTSFGNGIPATFYRVKARNNSGVTQRQCRGRVVNIQKKNIVGDFEEYGFNEQLQLTWGVHSASGPPLVTDIPNHQEEFLDVLFVTPLGNATLATQGFVAPNSVPHPFADEGEYLLTINVTSENSFQAILLVFGIVVVLNKPQREVIVRMRQL